MGIWRAYSLIVALSSVLVVSPAAAQQDAGAAYKTALAAAQNKDCKTALRLVAEQVGARGFGDLSDLPRLNLYWLGYKCAWKEGTLDLAFHYVQSAADIPEASPWVWQDRFALAWQTRHFADAVAAVEHIAHTFPDALNAIPITNWYGVLREAKSQPELRVRMLKVLTSPTYVPAEVGASSDSFRKDYATILVQAGDSAAAASLVAQIDEPSILKRVSLDPKLRAMVPADFDIRAAVERHMARMRELAAAHAGAIRPQLRVAEDLILLGKGEEALATLNAIHPDTAGDDIFSDTADQLNWWWDAKADAYELLGRYDETMASYAQGKAISEHAMPNISQTINMAGTQVRFGHPADALQTLAPFAAAHLGASPYGLMQFHTIQGCANHRTAHPDQAKADLDYLQTHVDDAPTALMALQLCMGDIAGAAAVVIRQLDNADQRVDLLVKLSDYAEPPATYPKDAQDLAAMASLKARADVQAAIARAGGTRKFDILP